MNPSPPKSPAPNRLCEGDAEADPFGRAEERILLREQFAADFGEMHGNDFAGIGAPNATRFLPVPRF